MAEIKDQVDQLNKNVETVIETSKEAKKLAEEASKKNAEMLAQLKELNDETSKNQAWRKEAEERGTKNQDAVNQLIVEVKTMRENGIKTITGPGNDFGTALAMGIKENFAKKDEKGRVDGISLVSKGKGYQFELKEGTGLYMKAASNMTQAGNLTGDSVITYVPTPVLTPRQMVNFRDLVPGFQSATGNVVIYREDYNGGVSPQEGAFGQQTTEGALKEQVGYNFTNVPFTAYYISGFVRIAKQMLQDLPFLQTYLPGMLLRDYYKKENAIFQAEQANAALGSTTTSATTDAGKFLSYITNLESANFAPNGIVTTPAVWSTLLQTAYPTTGTAYSSPLGFTYNQATTNIEIVGIPVLKATWMPSGTAFIADWTQSQIATVDGLKVEFFEQDSDNVQRNLITVRVEARVVLITGQPYAFTYATGL